MHTQTHTASDMMFCPIIPSHALDNKNSTKVMCTTCRLRPSRSDLIFTANIVFESVFCEFN